MENKKILIVGAGFSGSILARELAELNHTVKIIEKREHIAGNMYDYIDEQEVLIHKYGPHLLNTNNINIVTYLKQYTDIQNFRVKLKSKLNDKLVSLPFNFLTLQELFGLEISDVLIRKILDKYPNKKNVPIYELVESDDKFIATHMQIFFNKLYKNYCIKQWGLNSIDEMSKEVLDRVPFRLNYEINYLNTHYQFIPSDGYTKMFKNILNHKNIDIELNIDFLDNYRIQDNTIYYKNIKYDCVIYTGPIDELFNCKLGELEYRSLDFKYAYYNIPSYLEHCDVLALPSKDTSATRITEYTKINGQERKDVTTLGYEFPYKYDKTAKRGNEPYYPILDEKNKNLYYKYKELSSKINNLVLCGRLAEYKYFNMDAAIENALNKLNEIDKMV